MTDTTDTAGETPALGYADCNQIMRWLPHRPPFLLLDRMYDMEAGKRGTGLKNVTVNEPFFMGHFPGVPIMPGVLIIEAIAQSAGALVAYSLGAADTAGNVVYFMTIDKCRFRAPVVPGDTLIMPVTVIRSRGRVWRFKGEARVRDKLVAEAEFSAMIIDQVRAQLTAAAP